MPHPLLAVKQGGAGPGSDWMRAKSTSGPDWAGIDNVAFINQHWADEEVAGTVGWTADCRVLTG